MRLTYEDFCKIADTLFFDEIEMPSAKKTHDILGKGSLRDHQLYLEKWKVEKKKKPSTLPQIIEKNFLEKGRAFFEALWENLQKENERQNAQIKLMAENEIGILKKELAEITQEKSQALNKLEAQTKILNQLHGEKQQLVEKLELIGKHHFAATQKIHLLEVQLKESKESTKQEIHAVRLAQENERIQLNQKIENEQKAIKEKIQQLEQNHHLEIQESNEKLKMLMSDKQTVEKALSAEKMKYCQLENQVHALQKSLNNLEQQYELKKEETKKLKAEIQNGVMEKQLLKSENQQLTNFRLELKNENDRLNQKLLELSQKIGQLEQKIIVFKNENLNQRNHEKRNS